MIDVNSISYNEPAFFFNHPLPLFFFFFIRKAFLETIEQTLLIPYLPESYHGD